MIRRVSASPHPTQHNMYTVIFTAQDIQADAKINSVFSKNTAGKTMSVPMMTAVLRECALPVNDGTLNVLLKGQTAVGIDEFRRITKKFIRKKYNLKPGFAEALQTCVQKQLFSNIYSTESKDPYSEIDTTLLNNEDE